MKQVKPNELTRFTKTSTIKHRRHALPAKPIPQEMKIKVTPTTNSIKKKKKSE